MSLRRSLIKFKRLLLRYLRTYLILLRFKSVEREVLLTKKSHLGIGPVIFFGSTVTTAIVVYNALARYKIDDIELKPRFWQVPFELEILGVNLKNCFVEFVNALIVAALATILLKIFRQAISYRKCIGAFLYAYAISFLLVTSLKLVENVFFTSEELVLPGVKQWVFEGDRRATLVTSILRQSFIDNRLYPSLPSFLYDYLASGVAYFSPIIVSIFNTEGFAFKYVNSWHEMYIIIMVFDFKIALAAYILRSKILPSIVVIVFCSFSGIYIDAVLSRYTAKHTLLAYLSMRMYPSIGLSQAFKYSTTYFDSFPMKTGDLALVDFWQCKWSRHPKNRKLTDGVRYHSGGLLHFDWTYTKCDQAIPSVASFLVPEYEIVRVVAVEGQKVQVSASGVISVDLQKVADRESEEDVELNIYENHQEKYDTEQDGNITREVEKEISELKLPGKRYIYSYRRVKLPHDANHAVYFWECIVCGDYNLFEENYIVPQGYVFAMFDNMTRPRFVLARRQDIIGHPFLRAIKRW